MKKITIDITGDDFMKVMPRLDEICITTERTGERFRVHIRGVDADEYVVRKAVGYMENHGFIVSWEETSSDEAVVRKFLTAD
jgi:hypothetical protein